MKAVDPRNKKEEEDEDEDEDEDEEEEDQRNFATQNTYSCIGSIAIAS